MGSLVPSLITQSVVNDTHAADLTGSNTQAAVATNDGVFETQGKGGANALSSTAWSALIDSTETTLLTSTGITPGAAENVVNVYGTFQCVKLTSTGTVTIRLEDNDDGTTLASNVSGTIAINDEQTMSENATVTDVTVAAHTYRVTLDFSNADGGRWCSAGLFVCSVSGSLTGSDTHAADLTGSAGTCA